VASGLSIEGNLRDVPANTWIPHIEPSSVDAGGAFIVLDDHRRSNWTPYVFRTDDFGARWTRIADEDDVWGYALAIAQDPVDPDLLFLGTEFGLWVSTDGGGDWFKWTHGVPTVGVRDLVVHPRDHDLVLGTHGRAAYILDDVSPLRGLDGSVLNEELHLFPVSDAVQYRSRQTGASRFPGHGEFRGASRSTGALITLVVNGADLPHPDEQTERERQDAARAVDPPDPSDDEDAAAGTEGRGTSVELSVADESGTVIRTWEEEVHLGLNRVSWNLRRDGFKRPETGQEEEESSDFRPSGIRVLPGSYTLTVSFGDHEESSTFSVLADPRETASPEDRRAKYQALLAAGETRESVADALSLIYRIRSDVKASLDAADRMTRDSEDAEGEGAAEERESLEGQAREIRRQLKEIEERLWVPDHTKGIVYSDDRVWNQLGYAMGSMQSSWDAPTGAQLAYLAEAERAAAEVLRDLEALYSGEVASFREAVRTAGLMLMPEEDTPRLP
jgi:hypothetical protein